MSELVGQQVRYLNLLVEYDTEIIPCPGVSYQNTDGLSRQPCDMKDNAERCKQYLPKARDDNVCSREVTAGVDHLAEVHTDNVCSEEVAAGVDQISDVQADNVCSQEVEAGVNQISEAQAENVCSQEVAAGIEQHAEVQANIPVVMWLLWSGRDLHEPATTPKYVESYVQNDDRTLGVTSQSQTRACTTEVTNRPLNLTTDVIWEEQRKDE